MSYQVLARKWRPGTFDEMVGQTHVLRALANALDQNRLHHAYLFTGTRGVGKTTIARIFAKCVNCETGISSKPCGTCHTCEEIAAGRYVDLIEIDAASHTGVSEIREILDNVQYAPTRGRFKIYLIDEVHMLSNSSFNALLKTLEEPPPHIKFLLATTDPQKLPVTVLSRCLQFNLKNLSEKRIQQHLAHVLTQEQVPFDEEALWEIARSADGSMRDALSLTDQAIAFGEGAVRTADVVDMLGTVDRQIGRKLLNHVLKGENEPALHLCAQVAERSPDWKVLLQNMAELAHRVTLEQTVPGIVDDAQGDQAYIRELAGQSSPESLQLVYQIALAGLRDLPYAPSPRIGFEVTLVRMLAFTPDCPTGIAIDRSGSRTAAEQGAGTEDSEPEPEPAQPAQQAVRSADTQSSEAPPGQHLADISEAATSTLTEDPIPQAEVPTETDDVQNLQTANTVVATTGPETVLDGDPDAWRDAVMTEGGEAVVQPAETSQAEAQLEEAKPADAQPFAGQTDAGCNVSAAATHSPSAPPDTMATGKDGAGALENIGASKPHHQDALSMQKLESIIKASDPWLDGFSRLSVKGLTASLCQRLALVEQSDDHWHFVIDPNHSSLFTPTHQARLQEALSAWVGHPVRMTVDEAHHQRVTPAAQAEARAQLDQIRAEAAIEQDSNVQDIIHAFEGGIMPGSVRPRSASGEV